MEFFLIFHYLFTKASFYFMECIFDPALTNTTKSLIIQGDEYKHLKALRLDVDNFVIVINGGGLGAKARIVARDSSKFTLSILDYIPNMGESSCEIVLAIGSLDNKDRIEFAFEKAIELGITKFIILQTQYSSFLRTNTERLNQKAIATLKQCKRSKLPEIIVNQSLAETIESLDGFQIVFAEEFGKKLSDINIKSKVALFVGPEGGFSNDEKDTLIEKKAVSLQLGNRRLRAETAAITAIALISSNF